MEAAARKNESDFAEIRRNLLEVANIVSKSMELEAPVGEVSLSSNGCRTAGPL